MRVLFLVAGSLAVTVLAISSPTLMSSAVPQASGEEFIAMHVDGQVVDFQGAPVTDSLYAYIYTDARRIHSGASTEDGGRFGPFSAQVIGGQFAVDALMPKSYVVGAEIVAIELFVAASAVPPTNESLTVDPAELARAQARWRSRIRPTDPAVHHTFDASSPLQLSLPPVVGLLHVVDEAQTDGSVDLSCCPGSRQRYALRLRTNTLSTIRIQKNGAHRIYSWTDDSVLTLSAQDDEGRCAIATTEVGRRASLTLEFKGDLVLRRSSPANATVYAVALWRTTDYEPFDFQETDFFGFEPGLSTVWMRANHSAFRRAILDEDQNYRFEWLPPGDYTYEIWYDSTPLDGSGPGPTVGTVTLTGQPSVTVDF